MNAGDFRMTVEWHQNGQPRAYADTVREFDLTVDWVPYGKTAMEPAQWDEGIVLSHAQGVTRFKRKDEQREWHQAYLESCVMLRTGKWRIKVVEPFTD